MVIVEICLCTVLIATCLYATVSDIRASIIENRLLAFAFCAGLILNIVYYTLFANEYFGTFLMGFMVFAIISVMFYAFHFWAAGDSKLMILVAFLLPARVFGWEENSIAPAIIILIVAFSAAFIYVIGESIVIGVQKRDLFDIKLFRGGIQRFLKGYVLCGTYLTLLNQLVVLLFPRVYLQHAELFMLGSFFAAVLISEIEALKKPAILFPCLALALLLTGYTLHNRQMALDPAVFLALVGVVLLRVVAEKYNYQEIPTESVIPGMVLSFASVARINASTQKSGLMATEDVRSRLSSEEAKKVQAWGASKHGAKTVVIVRKIPFAIFISVGVIAFMLLRMCAHDLSY